MKPDPVQVRRTRNRLAFVKTRRPNALKGVNISDGVSAKEFRKVKRVSKRVRASEKAKQQAKAKPAGGGFNPLAPVTGKQYAQEEKAAQRAQFGGRTQELKDATAAQAQTTANVGNYYDDYKRALDEATARVKAQEDANAATTQSRVDQAFQQDSAAVQQRDAEAAKTADKFGFSNSGVSSEGAQAVEAARSQGNQAASRSRDLASADNKFMELRSANSVLAKGEALARERANSDKLRGEAKQLAADKGQFKNDFRAKTRESERTYALARKEFGLKEKDLNLRYKQSAADRSLERSKLRTQKLVANIYAAGTKAQARAQVRVAQIQLKKGKIDQHQFTTVKNIYEGLPAKGKPGKKGPGSGAGGKLATWEKDKVDNAVYSLRKHGALATDRATWMKKMQDAGVPLRLARIAWSRYAKTAPGSAYDKGNVPG